MDTDGKNDEVELDTIQNFPEKQKKKRSGTKKKKRAPTGFEEYYADPPTTPEEAAREQQELYNSSLLFGQRIQTCIHRYRTHRRLDPELAVYFNEYMFLGGVDTTTTAFNAEELEDGSLIPTVDEQDSTTAAEEDDDESANARFYDGNARHWAVDFAGVAAGFLSVSIVPLTGIEPAPTGKAVDLVENFLRYVLQHDVCPEYADDVKDALRVCARARDEWPRLRRFKNMLPGRFNLAAARTFGVHDEEADWAVQDTSAEDQDMSPALGFYASLVAAGQPVPKTESGESDLRLVRQFTCSLALQSVEMPSDDVSSFFRRLAIGSDDAHARLKLKPLGRAVFRPTDIEDGWVRQIPPERLADDEDVILLFEEDIMREMTVGMKVTALICELSSGLRFVKTLEDVQPSFYTFLPQHLIKDYKPPRIDDRPARSVHDVAAAAAAARGDEVAEEQQFGEE